MPEAPNDSLESFVRERTGLHELPHEKLATVEFLFDITEKIIMDTGPKMERFKFPFFGKTPFYQNNHTDVMLVDRLASHQVTILPYYEVDYNDEDCYDVDRFVSDELEEREVASMLAIDNRRQYKRNKLPIPTRFGKLALSSTCYEDKVLRVIETEKHNTIYNKISGLNFNSTLLVENLNSYGSGAECKASNSDVISMAKRVEEISRAMGVRHLVEGAVEQVA